MSNEVIEQPLVAPAASGPMKIIKIEPSSATGALQEREITLRSPRMDGQDITENLTETVCKRAGVKYLREAATLATFPALLRDGLKPILFNSYNDTPSTWNQLASVDSSNKPAEDYLELNQLGLLPQVGELAPYPEVDANVDRAVRIVNVKRGMIFGISREMVMFDRLNMIKQYPDNLGRAAKLTQEQAVYSVLTTTGNYVRNSTTGDNDIGANTAATTFSAINLNSVYSTLATMRDRKSGTPLNVMPNTLVVSPLLAQAAKQLLLSPQLQRVGGNTTNDVYGSGNYNPFKGMIDTIIVSPFMGGGSVQYNWILCERGKGVVYQDVEPLQMLTAGSDAGNLTEGYFVYDKIRYRVSIFFGAGMFNDRFLFYSNSNTAPIVA